MPFHSDPECLVRCLAFHLRQIGAYFLIEVIHLLVSAIYDVVKVLPAHSVDGLENPSVDESRSHILPWNLQPGVQG